MGRKHGPHLRRREKAASLGLQLTQCLEWLEPYDDAWRMHLCVAQQILCVLLHRKAPLVRPGRLGGPIVFGVDDVQVGTLKVAAGSRDDANIAGLRR